MVSESARALSRDVNGLRVRQNGRYRPRRRDLIVNWGSGQWPNWYHAGIHSQMLNVPVYVANASNKHTTFQFLKQNNYAHLPDFTTDINEAKFWLLSPPKWPRKLNAVVCRQYLRANSGRGIVLARTPDEVVPAPLYTRYTPKTNEYRIHVFLGNIIDQQEKRRVNGFVDEGHNKYIRNHPNGWVFCRENVTIPDAVKEASLLAVAALRLDFGAVDIGWHPELGPILYEVNTAPGLEGQTLTNYKEAILQLL